MPKISQETTTKISNNKNTSATITTTPTLVGTKTTTTTTTNANKTQIPSYQQQNNLNRFRRDDNLQQQQQQHYQNHDHHQPTHIPQPIAIGAGYYHNSNNLVHGTSERIVGGCGAGSGSSSATSSSPLSPPNLVNSTTYYANKDERDKSSITDGVINNETNKYYQKSPFLQRKFNNNAIYGGLESTKKETVPTTSVLSSIGQSIIRNLTTSPFSQKKHSIPQPNQIDPLWRMPTTDDVAVAFNCYDTTKANKSYTNSPFLGRKRIPTVDEKIIATATGTTANPMREREYFHRHYQQQQQPQTTLIPNEKTELTNSTQQQRGHGNQSPIVLQRFYHQQNQLREKELERLHQHKSPDRQQQTNPFLSNYQTNSMSNTATTTATAATLGNLHYSTHHYNTHIPMASGNGGAASISSHSNSSQSSSTLSTSSQIAQTPPQSSTNFDKAFINEAPTSAFGIGSPGGQLQYQPLPQQYLRANTTRNSRSPPTSPEQLSEPIVSAASGPSSSVVSKLNKFYARRHLQGTASLNASSNGRHTLGSDISMGSSSKENNLKEDHGWFNTLAGAMKRQFASYVKLQVNSAAAPTATASTSSDLISPTAACKNDIESTKLAGKTSLPYYQRSTSLTGNGSGCSSLSPTEQRARMGCIDANTTTGSFLRRYATSSSGAGSVGRMNDFTTPTAANAHILAGLDRRHRSPDPPPRYNRGQSPLLLRKNLLELSGQPPGGSPLLNRRYVTASPPLPPPRRGSESVPGSPQHFRTRIHYTPEPQRRIYRTIDQ